MQVLFLAHVPCRLCDAESLRCSYVYDLSLSLIIVYLQVTSEYE